MLPLLPPLPLPPLRCFQVRELAHEFCSDPVRINIGSADELVASKDIEQNVQVHSSSLAKLESLNELITDMHGASRRGDGCHTIVFVNRKRDADMVRNHQRKAISKKAEFDEFVDDLRELSYELNDGKEFVVVTGFETWDW